MDELINKAKIIDIITKCIEEWHKDDNFIYSCVNTVEEKIQELVRFNYNLWHLEDKARIPDADDKIIADVKRNIDKGNQNRNDKIEDIDDYFTQEFYKRNITPKKNSKMNSETLGSIIDRASILGLKKFHMNEEVWRDDVDDEHKKTCTERLKILNEQQNDILDCFEDLLNDILTGDKVHKIYKQFKMYNDPKFNPEIYQRNKS